MFKPFAVRDKIHEVKKEHNYTYVRYLTPLIIIIIKSWKGVDCRLSCGVELVLKGLGCYEIAVSLFCFLI